jgi:hypothetical protein
MTLSQALSPEEIKKIRKMTWINFAFTMLQVCLLARTRLALVAVAALAQLETAYIQELPQELPPLSWL